MWQAKALHLSAAIGCRRFTPSLSTCREIVMRRGKSRCSVPSRFLTSSYSMRMSSSVHSSTSTTSHRNVTKEKEDVLKEDVLTLWATQSKGEGQWQSVSLHAATKDGWTQGASCHAGRNNTDTKPHSSSLMKQVVHFFLPAGYPATVGEGYATYASLIVCGGIASSAGFVLSTQSLLYAVGLGAGSIPLAAAMNWVIKDGLGQFGGIVFAAWLGRRKGIDSSPKKWRSVSALAMDGATIMEIMSPLVPGHFLLVASLANIGKNIAFLSASASRAAIHNSFAIDKNLADLTAKAGSQSIFASLAGTALGVSLSPFVGSEWTHVAIGFACLSLIHQVCTFLALRAVPLRTFNRERLQHVLASYVAGERTLKDAAGANEACIAPCEGMVNESHVLSPVDVAQLERFFPLQLQFQKSALPWLDMTSTNITSLLPGGLDDYERWQRIISTTSTTGGNYILRADINTGIVHVGLLESASGPAVLEAALHAWLVNDRCLECLQSGEKVDHWDLLKATGEETAKMFPSFLRKVETIGWDCETIFIEPSSVRYAFHTSREEAAASKLKKDQ